MSKNLTKVEDFLTLFINKTISKEQRYGLLFTANLQQSKALQEILYNLVNGYLQLPKEVTRLLEKKRNTVSKFINPKISLRTKTKLLKTEYRYFEELLMHVRHLLKQMLK